MAAVPFSASTGIGEFGSSAASELAPTVLAVASAAPQAGPCYHARV